MGVKFKQVAFPREGRDTPLTGVTIRASGGKYNSETEGVLKLPDLGKLLLETEQANNGT